MEEEADVLCIIKGTKHRGGSWQEYSNQVPSRVINPLLPRRYRDLRVGEAEASVTAGSHPVGYPPCPTLPPGLQRWSHGSLKLTPSPPHPFLPPRLIRRWS